MRLFVSAIGTDSGKTVVSALLTHLLAANYWKPVQAGAPHDVYLINELGYPASTIYPSTYALKSAESPHSSAEKENAIIELCDFKLPETNSPLIVEGAGGLLAPLNRKNSLYDLATHLNLPIVLVVDYYLGSINHTLLSIEYLKNSAANVLGLILNGKPEPGTLSILKEKSPYPILLEVPFFDQLDRATLQKWAKSVNSDWLKI